MSKMLNLYQFLIITLHFCFRIWAASWQSQQNEVRPAKTQISLAICPVWSESLLSASRKLGSLATHWAHSKDSDQTGRMPFCWFCHDATHFCLVCSRKAFKWKLHSWVHSHLVVFLSWGGSFVLLLLFNLSLQMPMHWWNCFPFEWLTNELANVTVIITRAKSEVSGEPPHSWSHQSLHWSHTYGNKGSFRYTVTYLNDWMCIWRITYHTMLTSFFLWHLW